MNGMQATTTLALYLLGKLEEMGVSDVRVFKFTKQSTLPSTSCYIVVNSLPFTAGTNECTLNVNIHVPALYSGEVDSARLQTLQEVFESIVPAELERIENQDNVLTLEGCDFARYCDSNPMSDSDNTFFINNKVKVYNHYE